MGGYGSTRWNNHIKKHTVEDALILSIKALRKALRKGKANSGSVSWSTGERISYVLAEGWILLLFSAASVPIKQKIKLEKTSANLGGSRFWFNCPECSARAAKLYLAPESTHFLCRACHNLSYKSAQDAHKFRGSELEQAYEVLRYLMRKTYE